MNSGVVTIIGRPSAGKSTFLNTASGEKVSIVSAIPQTTRNAIRGIVNTTKGQIVFIDTPGYHKSEKKLNLKLQEIAKTRLEEGDAVLYLIDLSREFGEEEKNICSLLIPLQNKTVIGLNKADLKSSKADLVKKELLSLLPDIPQERIFEISALKDEGINEILSLLIELLPEGEALYPEDIYTDQDVVFRITEIIREQAILHTREEIPHALYAGVEDAEMRKNGKELWVRAFLYVEKESQKAMLIGKGAAVIKSIRIKSMAELRKIFPYKVQLDLQVRVNKNWRQKDNIIKKISY
ncbi:GTPase Era [Treponema denticola]|uniref:GTPase Era n=2 Tax=Treponema denticola TaxID=158 RepID=M1J8N3_TREDN|nr:GTPase Era [Treponema denticola]AFD04875.1 GTP-binding protein [Treponema denticola ATCC 35404]AFD04880.1 GTP-binding protein [Treponema denticola]AFD04882.1 GTP-binding protein [Treponema denticola]AFD04883.1 GTP-binding protein [Treponema denticola]AGE81905.1 GTP-binding protein [Treponema denticola]